VSRVVQGNLVGKTKEEVIALLGYSGTTDTTVVGSPRQDGPLVYPFDTGWSGLLYTLYFTNNSLIRIGEQGTY
jgi:hypothetical protein